MTLERTLHLATLLTVIAGATGLALGAGAHHFLLVSVALCLLSWRNERHKNPWRLKREIATALCLGMFLLTLISISPASGASMLSVLRLRVPRICQFLLAVQWVILFQERTDRDLASVGVITLILLAATGLMLPELQFIIPFLFVAAAETCMLTLLHLKMQRDLSQTASPLPNESSHRKKTWRFFAIGTTCAVGLLIPTSAIFALLPRSQGRPIILPADTRGATPVTGFSETATLGDVARIQESDAKVMAVSVLGSPAETASKLFLRMRGVGLDHYDGTGWTASRFAEVILRDFDLLPRMYDRAFPGYRIFHPWWPQLECSIQLETTDTRVLFAPFAVERIELLPGSAAEEESRGTQRIRKIALQLDLLNHTVSTAFAPSRGLRYRVVSRLIPTARPEVLLGRRIPSPLRGLRVPQTELPPEVRERFLQIPPNLSPRIAQKAREIAGDEICPTPFEKAAAIERHLSDPALYRYSLQVSASEGVEPVEDFLFNLRKGHCEYFASAMVMMLRTLGVPARLVNGFAGGEWNPFGGYFLFRQRHAHSWVEAYISPVGWMTFDPTPAGGLEEVRPLPGRLTRTTRNLGDYIQRLWFTYVIGYDYERQAVLFTWLRRPMEKVVKLIARFFEWAEELFSFEFAVQVRRISGAIGDFRGYLSPARWWLIAAGAGGATAMMVALAVARRVRARELLGRVDFYARLLKLLRRAGFERRLSMTPLELARQVVAQRGDKFAPVETITRSYYDVRYGGKSLRPAEREEIEEALRTIREMIR